MRLRVRDPRADINVQPQGKRVRRLETLAGEGARGGSGGGQTPARPWQIVTPVMQLTSPVHEVDDLDAFIELTYAQAGTDGLPVYPPTDARVEAMLAYLGRDPAEVIGVMPPGEGIATIEKSPSTRSWPAASPSTCPSWSPPSRRC
jgi:hypothetical protein